MQLKMGFWIYELGFFFLQMERGCQGIERIDVAKFPVKKYSDKFFAAGENSQYVIISYPICFVMFICELKQYGLSSKTLLLITI
jgi:hypothetical protein